MRNKIASVTFSLNKIRHVKGLQGREFRQRDIHVKVKRSDKELDARTKTVRLQYFQHEGNVK